MSKYNSSCIFPWTNITGSLPNIPTHKILYKTGTMDGELFLATDLGVYYRTDSQGDWVKLGQGLPNVIVNDIEIHYASNLLRAATFGRGVWEVPIDEASLSVGETQLPQNSVRVYPNPTVNKNFTISLNNLSGNTNILVYNLIGSVVKEVNTSATEEKISLHDGEWLDAIAEPDELVINVGDMLSRHSNNKLKSTIHRVVNPPRELWGSSRYSIPFFMHPISEMPLDCLENCIDEENPKKFEDITAGQFLNERLIELGLIKK